MEMLPDCADGVGPTKEYPASHDPIGHPLLVTVSQFRRDLRNLAETNPSDRFVYAELHKAADHLTEVMVHISHQELQQAMADEVWIDQSQPDNMTSSGDELDQEFRETRI